MVLSSQAQRRGLNHGGYVSTYRQKRRRRARRIAAVIGCVLAIYLLISLGGGSDEEGSNGSPSAAVADTAGDPAAAPSRPVLPQLPPAPPPAAAPASTPKPKPTVEKPAAPPTPTPKTDTRPTPAPTPAPPPTPAPAPASSDGPHRTSADAKRAIDAGRRMIANNQLVEGRDILNRTLAGPLSDADAADLRREIAAVNDKLVFSPLVAPGDPFAEAYVIEPNDRLSRIAPRYGTPWEFVSAVNNNLDPNRLRLGQRIKLVKGPFHAVVYKSHYRMDIYLGDPTAAGAMYVRSMDVGLGAHDGTPPGRYAVREQSKLINPEWTNPRTGERFLADDPKNPLGEFWIGIKGITPESEGLTGYGIHGTIEPETIGKQASMGCVRLRDDDIKLLFAMLIEGKSTVTILP